MHGSLAGAAPIDVGQVPGSLASLHNAQSLEFIENKGQWPTKIRFLSRHAGGNIWLTDFGMRVDASKKVAGQGAANLTSEQRAQDGDKDSSSRVQGHVFDVMFLNKSARAEITSEGESLPGYFNYFIGNDPSKHASYVRRYGEVREKNTWEGIDTVYRAGANGSLEYDFEVAPEANVSQILLGFRGQDGLSVEDGVLMVETTHLGKIAMPIPESYQIVDGEKRLLEVWYELIEDEGEALVAFRLPPSYNPTYPLVIDPTLSLNWGTFVSNALTDAYIFAAVVDASGNVIFGGESQHRSALSYPATLGAFDETWNGGRDAYVTQISADGLSHMWSTYLGGSGYDHVDGMALGPAGNIIVAGENRSADFPVTTSIVPCLGASSFVTKLNNTGSALVWSTCTGHGLVAWGFVSDIVLDSSSNPIVTGIGVSSDFATTGAYQGAYAGGANDGFLAKITADGSALSWATFIGDTLGDYPEAVAVDSSDNVIIAGYTLSTNYPTTVGAHDQTHGGSSDAMVSKFNSDGTGLLWSTFLGDTGAETAWDLEVDGADNLWVVGDTASTDFPTTSGAYDEVGNVGTIDGFITRFSSSGMLGYSSFLGGDGEDIGWGVSVFGATSNSGCSVSGGDLIFVQGQTTSSDFPPTNADSYQQNNGGGIDTFLAVLDLGQSGTSQLYYSTYFGGSIDDYPEKMGGPLFFNSDWIVVTTAHSADYPLGATGWQTTKLNTFGFDTPAVLSFDANSVFQFDYGDAPKGYDGNAANSAARHCPSSDLYLGTLKGDSDSPPPPWAASEAAATGDDLDGTNDEDGVGTLATNSFGGFNSATLPVTFVNNTATDAQVVCWIDWNDDEDFLDSNERSDPDVIATASSCADVATATSDGLFEGGNAPAGCSATVTMQWPNLSSLPAVGTDVYSRCRITTEASFFSDASPSATGAAADGEVEDDELPIPEPTAVTIGDVSLENVSVDAYLAQADVNQLQALLASFGTTDDADATNDMDKAALIVALTALLDPDGDGQVAVLRWDTLEERGTIGFYVERQSAEDSDDWNRINNDLLPGLITAPMGAEYLLADPGAQSGITYQYRLIELEATGNTRQYGPFRLRLP